MKKEARIFLTSVSFLVTLCQSSVARGDEPPTVTSGGEPSIKLHPEKSYLQLIQDRLRVRTFSEFMTPAMKDNPSSVPDMDGSHLAPTNVFNIFWADYEIAQDIKIVYWQRFMVSLVEAQTAPAMNTVARNPRFALRKVQVFQVPNLNTTYDLYIQPGIAPEASEAGRDFEFGFRTANAYQIPKSNWNIGSTIEFTVSLSKEYNSGSNLYGWIMNWASYDLNKVFATEHFLTVNFQHNRGTQGLQWDYPMPYIQNGIGANLSKTVWAAVFLNNYLGTVPTLANTWASLWLSLTVL